jgi:signal transduction histidine kinase
VSNPTVAPGNPRSRWYQFGWLPLRWLLIWSVKLPYLSIKWAVRGVIWLAKATISGIGSVVHPSWWRQQIDAARNLTDVPVIPLRKWLVLSLVALIALPIITGNLADAILRSSQSHPARNAEEILLEGQDRWNDPVWQASAAAELDDQNTEVILYEDGREVFRTTDASLKEGGFSSGLSQFEFDNNEARQTAYIYRDTSFENIDEWQVPLVVIVTLLLTFAAMAIFIGKSVVQPLEATGSAAADVAGGDLNISLPSSYVREVAELNLAFEGMAGTLAETLRHESDLEAQRKIFIGAIAHDLRTPLFSLRGSLEAIQTGIADTPEKQQHYLEIARNKADALDRLVSDLFDYVRVDFLDLQQPAYPVDLGSLLARSVDSFQPRAEARQISLSLANQEGSALAMADESLLTRAIDNLIDNAIRYTPPGGAVQVECRRVGSEIEIAVIDNGPGISEGDLTHVFEPMYRGETSRNVETGGLGLGLSIARSTIRANGGDIRVSKRPGGGAEFVASLPILGAAHSNRVVGCG